MFGKFFASAFTGSMMGMGSDVFAVWGYVIANTDSTHHVELNPRLVSVVIGCDIECVKSAVAFLCAPDLKSRSEEENGKRLIKVGEFSYFVTNHESYSNIRDENQRRGYMRKYMVDYRKKKTLK